MEYFTIGKIVNTQGLHGETRVMPSTDDPSRFTLLGEVELFTPRGARRVCHIENVRFHKQFVILKFTGIDTIEDAEALRNSLVKIPRSLALPLKEDEYYMHDLYGMNVVTEDGEELGTITDIYQTGANDVYAVKSAEKEPLLIPAIKQCVLSVDVDGRKMTVRLMEGLR